jgi:hypothetical protein
MRAPIRSESDAFRLTVGVVAALIVAILLGALITPLVGVGVFIVALLAGLTAYLVVARSDHRPILAEAAQARHPHGAAPGKRHVLVVANETLVGRDLLVRIARDDPSRVEIDVLAPVLSSRLHLGMTDIDGELRSARTRLDRSLAWARDQGLNARGEVGDPSPTVALEDELRDFGADEVIVVTGPEDGETWQERGELERLRDELDVPVTHIVIGDDPMPRAT